MKTLNIYSTFGDVNPIEYGGGVVVREENGSLVTWYTEGLEAYDNTKKHIHVYRYDVSDIPAWPDYGAIADACDSDVARKVAEAIAVGNEPIDLTDDELIDLHQDIVSYWGANELDQYPVTFTRKELRKLGFGK